jgi:DNA invertase Pin-like site-specific DNA recombinase
MGRKPRVDRSAEEKWQIVQEGLKSGNVSETCRRFGIAQTLYYCWKDEAEQVPRPAWGEKRGRRGNREGSPHSATGADAGPQITGDRNPKKRRGGVSCGEVHSQAREMLTQGYAKTLVTTTLAISRSSISRRLPRIVDPVIRRCTLDGRVSQLGRSTSIRHSLDRRVKSRPASSRSPKSHSARGLPGFRRGTKK